MALSHACHASPPFSKILIKNIYSANFKEKFSVVVGNSLAWSFPQRTNFTELRLFHQIFGPRAPEVLSPTKIYKSTKTLNSRKISFLKIQSKIPSRSI